MLRTYKVGAALLIALLLSMPALATPQPVDTHRLTITSDICNSSSCRYDAAGNIINDPVPQPSREVRIILLILSLGIAGTVTLTYKYPVGTTVPPTAIQASQVQVVIGEVNWADSDTTTLFTHNFGIATAPGFAGILPGLISFFPEVMIVNSGVSTVAAAISVAWTNGTTLTLGKGSILGTAGTIIVYVRKPHSIGQ